MIADKEQWLQRGQEARLAHEAVHLAFRAGVREKDARRYDELLEEFRIKTAAALPSGDPAFMPALAKGMKRTVSAAIAFLEADPWFFRSGYEKQAIIQYLKRATLTVEEKKRLGDVVLNAVDGRDRVEFRHYCRLACGAWSEALDAGIATRLQSADAGVRRRATWVAKAAVSAGKA